MKFIKTAYAILLLFGLLLIFTLSACKQEEQSHDPLKEENEKSNGNIIRTNEQQDISYSFSNPKTGQEFSIIHAYLLYSDYFATVKDNPDESHYKLYQKGIIKPIYETCFKDAEIPVNTLEWTPRKSDFAQIEKQITSMNKDLFNEEFEEALVKSSDILPTTEKTTVCIFPKNETLPSDMMTIGSGKIIVSYIKFHKTDKSAMSHEYHHSVWMGKHVTGKDLMTGLDHFISEGQAVMFETEVYPDLNSTYYLVDESFNKEYWSEIEPYLDKIAPREINKMKIGGFNGLPSGYGYSEGYKMVRSYLTRHPNMTVEEWTSKSSKEIFEEGNYKANYQ